MSGKQNAKLIAILEDNWQAEMRGHYTYQTLSEAETDPRRRNALRGLAAAERHHANLWSKRLHELDVPTLAYRGSETGDAEALAATIAGSAGQLRRLEVDESRDIARYYEQLVQIGDAPSVAILDEVIADEKEHYRILGTLLQSESTSADGSMKPSAGPSSSAKTALE